MFPFLWMRKHPDEWGWFAPDCTSRKRTKVQITAADCRQRQLLASTAGAEDWKWLHILGWTSLAQLPADTASQPPKGKSSRRTEPASAWLTFTSKHIVVNVVNVGQAGITMNLRMLMLQVLSLGLDPFKTLYSILH